jgi:hypothetical protein
VGDGGFGVEECAAVGERVGSNVEDAHNEGARAGGQGASAELPGGASSLGKGHPKTMLHAREAAEFGD